MNSGWMGPAVFDTHLSGLGPRRQGKVRDMYDLGDCLLLIASDRISAFDVVLPEGIPGKGYVLTQLSKFWFERLWAPGDLVPHHLRTMDPDAYPEPCRPHTDILRGRSMLVEKGEPFPVECIVRGYLSGSAWKEYKTKGTVCGQSLPSGLQESDRFSEPLFTPPTLYNGGLSSDVRAVVSELAFKDGIESVWVAGYSMGGSLVLRMAGEVGDRLPALRGVAAVSPNINPAVCVETLQQRQNWIYHLHFLIRLKARLRRKAGHYPGKYDLSLLPKIRTMSEFDNTYTAPDGGYVNAADYYERTGARHVLDHIRVPTLIITAQDDPFIPYQTFDIAPIHSNPHIRFVAPPHGGHCGFFQRTRQTEDHYWAENRIVEFIQNSETCPPS